MSEFNINVKVRGGVRTPIQVSAMPTGVNEKVIKLANGYAVTDGIIALQIEADLKRYLQSVELLEG